jgi:hypothetical protein
MAFKVFVSPVLEMVSSPNCRAVFCDFRVRCALGGASCGTIVLHSTICPDDTSNPNVIGEDWQTFPADRSRTYPLQPLGNGLIQAVDHTGGGVGLMGAFLRRGYHFKVCVDLDNDDDIHAMEWTGLTIYAPGPNFALTRSVRRAPGQLISINCPRFCDDVRVVLGTSCFDFTAVGSPPRGNLRSGYVDFVQEAAGTPAQYHACPDQMDDLPPGQTAHCNLLDASLLDMGRHYKICADEDGPGPLFEGETGALVYVTPVTGLITQGMHPLFEAFVLFECPICTSVTSAYLGLLPIGPAPPLDKYNRPVLYCDATVKSGKMAPSGGSRTASSTVRPAPRGRWLYIVDSQLLTPGSSYMLCLDIDGPVMDMGFGETNYAVYVSGVTFVHTSAVFAQAAQEIRLDCSICNFETDQSFANLMTECDRTKNGGYVIPPVDGVQTQLGRIGDGITMGKLSALGCGNGYIKGRAPHVNRCCKNGDCITYFQVTGIKESTRRCSLQGANTRCASTLMA